MSFYYVVTLVFLAPFFILYCYSISKNRFEFVKSLKRLGIAVIPAVLWLLFSVTHPIPQVHSTSSSPYPNSGEAPQGYVYHPFLDWFGAHPIDYFTGDVGVGVEDSNPIREDLNRYVYANPLSSNAHERANGIRWSLWCLAFLAIMSLKFKKNIWDAQDKKLIYFFIMFGIFSFFLSLSPNKDLYFLSPAIWLNKLVSQIRVPNRAGMGVHFSIIMISGIFLKNVLNNIKLLKTKRWINLIFPLIIILDFPPMNLPVPMSPVLPPYQELVEAKSNCGFGIQYPYSSGQIAQNQSNYFVQRLRGTRCSVATSTTSTFVLSAIASKMGLTSQFLADVEKGDENKIQQLKNFAECVPLSWVVFYDGMTIKTQQQICNKLGWTLKSQGVCRSLDLNKPLINHPDKCISAI
jgi:hypothetical protein